MSGSFAGWARGRGLFAGAALVLVLLHMGLLLDRARRTPFTVDEPAYILAGRALVSGSRWSTLQERLQGPLPLWASQLFAGEIDPDRLDASRFSARAGMLLFSLLLLVVLWAWAGEAWGRGGALLVLFLASSSPMLLGYGSLVGADLAWTAFTCLTLWLFWRWLRAPTPARLLLWSAALGLTLATKYLAFLLLLFLPVPAAILFLKRRERWFRWVGSMLLAGAAILIFLHAAYLFRAPLFGTGRAGDLQTGLFRSLASLPVVKDLLGLLPEPLVLGADYQKAAAARFHGAFLGYLAPHPVFLLYYPLSLLLKVPSALPVLVILGMFAASKKHRAASGWTGWVLEGPALFLAAAVTLTGGLKIGIRYVLPLIPLGMVRAGCWGGLLGERGAVAKGATALLLGWFGLSSLLARPHYLGYFNELAGGPGGGWRFFADSNCDWGQDKDRGLAFLKARRPGLEALGPWDGPRFGLLAAYTPWLQPPDPFRKGRTYHWIRRFRPLDHYAAAWLVFRVGPRDFLEAARKGDGRAGADLSLAWIRAGRLDRAREALALAAPGPWKGELASLLESLAAIEEGRAREGDWSLASQVLSARGEVPAALKLLEKAPSGMRGRLLLPLLLQGKEFARAGRILQNELRKGPMTAEKALMVSCGLYWSGDLQGALRVLGAARPPGAGDPLEKTWKAFEGLLRKALEAERRLRNPGKH